jgi:hypothetical protein
MVRRDSEPGDNQSLGTQIPIPRVGWPVGKAALRFLSALGVLRQRVSARAAAPHENRI